MSKRGSSKQLRPDEEDDEAPTEAGKWEEAPESVIAKRKIVKVRSKNSTETPSNAPVSSLPPKAVTTTPVAEAAPQTESAPNTNTIANEAAPSTKEPEKSENEPSKDSTDASTTKDTAEVSKEVPPATVEAPKFEVKLAGDFSFKPTQTQASSAAKPVFQFSFQTAPITNGDKETPAAVQPSAPFNFTFNFTNPQPAQSGFQWKFPDPATASKSAANADGDAEGDEEDANGKEGEASGEYDESADNGTGRAEPILPEVAVVTGEEDDESLCKYKAKLLSLTGQAWTERGVGIIHLYKHKQGTYRLVMRTLGTLRLILNSVVVSKTLSALDKDNPKCIRITLTDTIGTEKKEVTAFAIRFQNPLDASQMHEYINKAKTALSKSEAAAEKGQ